MLRNFRNFRNLRNLRNLFSFRGGRPFRPPLAKGVAFCDPLRKKTTNNSDGHEGG